MTGQLPSPDRRDEHQVVATEFEADTERSELLRLAAARAALDPDRRAWRNDILLSAIIEALSLYGPLTSERLLGAVSRGWATGTISRHTLDGELATAVDAGLVNSNQSMLSHQQEWCLTDATRREAAQDRLWVERTFDDFADELVDRVNEVLAEPVRRDRAKSLAQTLFAALAHGARGSYEFAQNTLRVADLRPLEIDMESTRRHLDSQVQPPSVATAVQSAASAVLDPGDPFGNDILRLLVVGNILQGLLSGRDLAADLGDRRFRFVVDTSALTYLLGEGTPERTMLLEFFDRARRAEAEVVVPHHVLDEWDRLWEAGVSEVASVDESKVRALGAGYALVNNPVAREYVRYLTEDPDANLTRFSLGRRDPSALLEGYGVVIRPHGNERDEDREFVAVVHARLTELSEDPKVGASRRPAAAETDAQTSGMVARWRRNRPDAPPSAWMVGTDRLSDRAYRGVTTDGYGLCLPTSAALLLLSAVCGDGSNTVAGLVETVSTAATRDSFLAVASTYSLEEVIDLAEKMSLDATLTPEDAAIAVQLNFETLLRESQRPQTEEERRALSTQAVQRRGQRQTARAARMADDAAKERERSDERADAARRDGEQRGRQSVDGILDQERQRRTAADERAERYLRGGILAIGTILAAAILTVLLLTETIGTDQLVFPVIAIVGLIALGIRFVVDVSISRWMVISEVLLLSAVTALSLISPPWG